MLGSVMYVGFATPVISLVTLGSVITAFSVVILGFVIGVLVIVSLLIFSPTHFLKKNFFLILH